MISPYLAPQKHFAGTRASSQFADRIIESVLQYTGYPIEVIKKRSRKREIVYVRQLLSYFLHTYSSMTCKQIGEILSEDKPMDHTTIVHNKQKIKDLRSVYSEVQLDCENIFHLIMESEQNAMNY